MNCLISAELYKLRHCRLLWCVPVIFAGIGIYYASWDFRIFGMYQGLEHLALPTIGAEAFSFAVCIGTGYVIGLDFSQGTVRNILSVGTARRTYYFSRMGVLLALTALMYGIAALAYAGGRLCFYPATAVRPRMEEYWLKLAVCVGIAVLQLMAKASVVHAVCYFVKKQLPAIGIGTALVYGEMILRPLADMYGITFMRDIFDYEPIKVLKNTFDRYAVYDKLLTFDFLKFGISAAVIIVASGAAGYVKFRYYPGKDS